MCDGEWSQDTFRTHTICRASVTCAAMTPSPLLPQSDLVPEFMNGGNDKDGNGNGRQKARGPKGGYTGGATVRPPQEERRGGRR